MLLFSFSHIPVRLPYVVSIGQYNRFFCSWQAPRWEISGGAAAWVSLSNKLDKEADWRKPGERQRRSNSDLLDYLFCHFADKNGGQDCKILPSAFVRFIPAAKPSAQWLDSVSPPAGTACLRRYCSQASCATYSSSTISRHRPFSPLRMPVTLHCMGGSRTSPSSL